MRLVFIRLSLALALASAQMGGVAHGLSHLQKPPSDQLLAGTLHSHHCVVCDAYNVFDHGVSGAARDFPFPRFHAAPLSASSYEFFLAEVSPFRIRAPPV